MKKFVRDWQVLLLFTAGTFLVYGRVLTDGFLTDDYAALYRVGVLGEVLHDGFLRPLIDISFGFNYILGGLHPVGYYLFNFAIHILCCYGVYKVATILSFFDDGKTQWMALAAGIVFLFYPFHNESVVWLAGRLSSMATLCGLWAVYYTLRDRGRQPFVVPAILFFIGLLAYESIIVLPGIMLVLTWRREAGVGRMIRPFMGWAAVLVSYLVLRFLIAHVFFSGYSSGVVVSEGGRGYGAKLIKAVGRNFLPPMESSKRMVICFVFISLILVVLHWVVWRYRHRFSVFFREYARVVVCWGLALLPPIAFGISTRTSEGDRMLYFPSVWLCILVCAWVFRFIGIPVVRMGLIVVMCIAGWLSIRDNNSRWVYASDTAKSILDTIRNSSAQHVVLINPPDEYEGAFIFRNNLDRALVINGIDTNKVFTTGNLMRLDYLQLKGTIKAMEKDGGFLIYPFTQILPADEGKFRVEDVRAGVSREFRRDKSVVYYWDGVGLQTLNLN